MLQNIARHRVRQLQKQMLHNIMLLPADAPNHSLCEKHHPGATLFPFMLHNVPIP